ncbi:septum formation initiator family protein [Dysgonomonas sp. 511]|uniref:FtsB family cell division protein n=1 Tax=Dysgonomonas sp. 511 TaxID=2302930 RepID=UPI0013CF61BD|nr:septum formation initiator family protein [Dysgonomonas sp. 511]NDV78010.1 hypothetical protein [Dysgonomonas sp. 511]
MKILNSIFKYIRTKYTAIQLLLLAVIIVYAFFISEGSLIDRFTHDSKIRELNSEIDVYKKKIAEDVHKLQQIESDAGHIERFARENYLMKKENEDVFIIE